jgi:hypothetical protein
MLACQVANAASVGFRTRELPWAGVGAPYRATIETFVDGRCIDGGISFVTIGGALPTGLELRGAMISGTPEESGAFHFRLQAVNNCGMEERDFLLQVTGRPILRVAPECIDLEYAIGGTPPETTLLVSATWPHLLYSINQSSAPWLQFRQSSGLTPGPNTPYAGDVVTLQITPEKLDPGTYHATLSFAGPSGAAPLTVPVRLRVIAPVPH